MHPPVFERFSLRGRVFCLEEARRMLHSDADEAVESAIVAAPDDVGPLVGLYWVLGRRCHAVTGRLRKNSS